MGKRFFEVKLNNGNVMVLSKKEIEKYKKFIESIRKELTKKELKALPPIEPLSKSNIEYITK